MRFAASMQQKYIIFFIYQRKLNNFAKILSIMNKTEILSLFKFYKKEDSNPFEPNSLSSRWWDGEKSFYNLVSDNSAALKRITNELQEGIDKGLVSPPLTDNNLSIEHRALIFYLDLWNGKWFPYDNLDFIQDYIKA